MKLELGLSNWSKKRLQHKCYNSIYTLPIGIWNSIQETGDLTLLYKQGGKKSKHLEGIWNFISNQYISKIGLAEDHKEYLDKIKRRALLQLDCVLNPTPLSNAELAIMEAQIEELSKQKKVDFIESIASISKSVGFRVDPKTTSVAEYYGYIKMLRNAR